MLWVRSDHLCHLKILHFTTIVSVRRKWKCRQQLGFWIGLAVRKVKWKVTDVIWYSCIHGNHDGLTPTQCSYLIITITNVDLQRFCNPQRRNKLQPSAGKTYRNPTKPSNETGGPSESTGASVDSLLQNY